MMRRVEEVSSDLVNKVRNKAKEFEICRLALDESNDTSDTAKLLTAV
jgi:hypothetical protein